MNRRKFLALFAPSSKMRLLLVVILLISLPLVILFFSHRQQTRQHTATPGSVYYVSKNGNNADGKSWATAWDEFNKINWSGIRPGDTILLDGGSSHMVYTTTLAIGKSGKQGLPIAIRRA